jgi:hypothetical protein
VDSDARKKLEDRLVDLTAQRKDVYDRRMKAKSKTTQAQLDRALAKLESDITSVENALK